MLPSSQCGCSGLGEAWRGEEEPPPFPSWQTECRLSPISGPQDPVSVQILVCEEAAVLLRRRQMLKRGPAWALWPHPKARQACLHPPSENSDLAPPCILSLGDPSQTQVSLCELVFQAARSLTGSPSAPSPFSLPSRSRPGLHCLPKSCDNDAAAHVLVHSFFYHASLAWTG